MNARIQNLKILTILISLFILSIPSHSMCPEEQGRQIAKAMQQATSGWGNIKSDMEMVIKSPNGKTSTLQLQSQSLEASGDGDKTKIVFSAPRTVQGTTLLSHSHLNDDDQQWIYIPKSNRVKRIAGKNKSRSFVGSQYSFEDLASFKMDKYRYRFLREEACGESTCSVLISYPEYKGSAYSKIVSWIDKQSRVQKAEYYDRDQELLKTLTIKEYLHIDGQYWQPRLSEMLNHQNGKSTQLSILKIERNIGLSAKDFDKSTLKKS